MKRQIVITLASPLWLVIGILILGLVTACATPQPQFQGLTGEVLHDCETPIGLSAKAKADYLQSCLTELRWAYDLEHDEAVRQQVHVQGVEAEWGWTK